VVLTERARRLPQRREYVDQSAERVRFGTFELNVRTGELVSIGTAAVEARSAKMFAQAPARSMAASPEFCESWCERQGNIVTREEYGRFFGRTIPSWNLIEALTLQWRSSERRSQTMPIIQVH